MHFLFNALKINDRLLLHVSRDDSSVLPAGAKCEQVDSFRC